MSAAPTPTQSRGAHWAGVAERGSSLAMQATASVYQALGRRLSGLLLYPIVAYFFATGRGLRDASRGYLERVAQTEPGRAALGGRPRARHVYRHLLEFAESILDRLCFWAGRHDGFSIDFQGREHLMKHVEAGRGAILLGAHLGSFDVLRVLAEEHDIIVNVLMYTGNAQHINAVLRRMNPETELRVIQLDAASVRAGFEVKACLDRGEFVAVLGDRVAPSGRERVVEAPFFGSPAAFPEGPFRLAALLGVPMLLTLALRTSPRSYRICAEPFDESPRVPRARRDQDVAARIERFASRLEHYASRHPYQWFNFYDFWGTA
ncbi:MAG: lipid A biosynthesis acyltransferase [Proteobacteria bacterium]|nr:lipid A biosynthesis acyltransferase [Pseudomonadota bacterium]